VKKEAVVETPIEPVAAPEEKPSVKKAKPEKK